jgi:hypothetical protein
MGALRFEYRLEGRLRNGSASKLSDQFRWTPIPFLGGLNRLRKNSFEHRFSRALYKGTASAGPIKPINPTMGFSPCNC